MTKTKRPLVQDIEKAIMAAANPVRGRFLQRFFKTGPGEYGEGDQFLGLTVPHVRKIAHTYQGGIQLADIDQLLEHEAHEVRLLALIMLVKKYTKGSPEEKNKIYEFYLQHTARINNWDLVDTSAPQIIGNYILEYPSHQKQLTAFLSSSNLWERRMSIIALFPLIKAGEFELPLKHLTFLVNDSHDLIQKSVGWVLRALGDTNRPLFDTFMMEHGATMPRVSLRYAIEHLNPTDRQKYLQLKKTKESHARHSVHP